VLCNYVQIVEVNNVSTLFCSVETIIKLVNMPTAAVVGVAALISISKGDMDVLYIILQAYTKCVLYFELLENA